MITASHRGDLSNALKHVAFVLVIIIKAHYLTFSVFDSEFGGKALWIEKQNANLF